MSVYLYLICEDCERTSDVIGRNSSGEGSHPSEGGMTWRLYKEATPFLIRHLRHHVRLVPEPMDETPAWYRWEQEREQRE